MAFSLFDLLFPKCCVSCGALGSYLCNKCFSKVDFVEHPVCPVCTRQAVGGKTHPGCRGKFKLDGLAAGARYKGSVKVLIAKVKYRWASDIGETLCSLIERNLWKFDFPKNIVLVPIPLHRKRKNWRGFNQAELICQILSRKFGVRVADILERVVETKTQVGLSRDERKVNIKDAFKAKFQAEKGSVYVLADDVYTTGATMQEACKVLKRSGAGEVWGMVVALG